MDEKIWDCNRVESISLDFVEPITTRSGSRLSWYKSQVSENAVPDIELLTVNINLGRNQWKAQVRKKNIAAPKFFIVDHFQVPETNMEMSLLHICSIINVTTVLFIAKYCVKIVT